MPFRDTTQYIMQMSLICEPLVLLNSNFVPAVTFVKCFQCFMAYFDGIIYKGAIFFSYLRHLPFTGAIENFQLLDYALCKHS